MGHVFISYSRQDRTYVERLAEHLQNQGIDVWYDYEVETGDRWSTVIRRQIETCDAMIVVMTRQAEASEMVENEIDLARSRGKPIMPLLLDGEPFFGMRHVQYTDVRTGKLPGTKFTKRLRRAHLGATAPVAVPALGPDVQHPSPAARQEFVTPTITTATVPSTPLVRPRVISIAAISMRAAAAAYLLGVIIQRLPNDDLSRVLNEYFADNPEAVVFNTTTVWDILTVTTGVILIGWLTIGGVVLSKRSQPARIITWVLCALGVPLYGGTFVRSWVLDIVGMADADKAAELNYVIAAWTPAWQQYLTAMLGMAFLSALLLVIILLAFPSASAYFRQGDND